MVAFHTGVILMEMLEIIEHLRCCLIAVLRSGGHRLLYDRRNGGAYPVLGCNRPDRLGVLLRTAAGQQMVE